MSVEVAKLASPVVGHKNSNKQLMFFNIAKFCLEIKLPFFKKQLIRKTWGL